MLHVGGQQRHLPYRDRPRFHFWAVLRLPGSQEFIDTFPDGDLAGDVEFQKNLAVIKNAMQGVTIDRLKESKNLQTYVMTQLDSVRQDMKNLVIVSGRKFR